MVQACNLAILHCVSPTVTKHSCVVEVVDIGVRLELIWRTASVRIGLGVNLDSTEYLPFTLG